MEKKVKTFMHCMDKIKVKLSMDFIYPAPPPRYYNWNVGYYIK